MKFNGIHFLHTLSMQFKNQRLLSSWIMISGEGRAYTKFLVTTADRAVGC